MGQGLSLAKVQAEVNVPAVSECLDGKFASRVAEGDWLASLPLHCSAFLYKTVLWMFHLILHPRGKTALPIINAEFMSPCCRILASGKSASLDRGPPPSLLQRVRAIEAMKPYPRAQPLKRLQVKCPRALLASSLVRSPGSLQTAGSQRHVTGEPGHGLLAGCCTY